MNKGCRPAKKGFKFYRTNRQILEYMKVPARRKLEWLEEMWEFNRRLGLSNPKIAFIQDKLRRGEF